MVTLVGIQVCSIQMLTASRASAGLGQSQEDHIFAQSFGEPAVAFAKPHPVGNNANALGSTC